MLFRVILFALRKEQRRWRREGKWREGVIFLSRWRCFAWSYEEKKARFCHPVRIAVLLETRRESVSED